VEWFAAVLSTVGEDTEKAVSAVGECRRLGVRVLAPDVNKGGVDFLVEALPEGDYGVRYGLKAIKNVGEGAVELVVAERDANGPYKDLSDFCRRLDLHTVNRRVIESLIKSGALDSFGAREAQLKALDSAMGAAQIEQQAASVGQTSLFDAFGPSDVPDAAPMIAAFSLPIVPPVPARERSAWEKEVMGFNFQDHPYQEPYLWLRTKLTHDSTHLTSDLAGEKVKLGGVVVGVRKLTTKTKGQMAVLTVEDLNGSFEVVAFPRIYEKSPDLWFEDKILIIEGKVDSRDDRAQIILDKAEEWEAPADGTPPPPPGPAPVPAARVAPAGHGARPGAPEPRTLHDGPRPVAPPPIGPVVAPPAPAAAAPVSTPTSVALRIAVPRNDDDNACVRLLEQIHALVETNSGQDQLELVLTLRNGSTVLLAGIHIRRSPELERQLRALVGETNVGLAATPVAAPAF
jgi:DNA polymerase-3 subunit alpha